MKLPNGYGSVTKLSGNRRNPYMVRKTIGWNDKGYPIYQPIGYTKTREDGLIMLAEYNHAPWDIDAHKMTFQDVYDLWLEKKFPKLGDSLQAVLKSAYNHCKSLYDMRYRDIKAIHMQDCIDYCSRGYSTQGAIKNLFGHLDKFALELDVINKSYAQLVAAEPIPETTKGRFSNEQIDKIWEIYESGKYPWSDSILVFIYTGFRITELLTLETVNVDMENRVITGGIKTAAGKNRIIPIHPLIYDIIEKRVKEGNKYLFTLDGKHLPKRQYYELWYEVIDQLGERRTPHECRHTFRSLLDDAGANKKCIDMLMGHKSKDVGERRYTHKSIESLREAIELIKR